MEEERRRRWRLWLSLTPTQQRRGPCCGGLGIVHHQLDVREAPALQQGTQVPRQPWLWAMGGASTTQAARLGGWALPCRLVAQYEGAGGAGAWRGKGADS